MLNNIDKKIIFPHDNNISINFPNLPPKFKDKLILGAKYDYAFSIWNQKEAIFREIIAFLLKENIIKNNIIDSGAWIGDNALPWAKNTKNLIYAIDPSSTNIEFIKTLCSANNITNVQTLTEIISDKVEEVSMSSGDNIDINHAKFNTVESQSSNSKSYKTTTLDLLYSKKIIENIGFIHLDVEGFEYKAISGAEKVINEFRPIITFEQHLGLDDFKIICDFLGKYDYRSFLINEKAQLPATENCVNFISFPKNQTLSSLIYRIENYLKTKQGLNKMQEANPYFLPSEVIRIKVVSNQSPTPTQ